jgi:ubiquinone/menaquinone biosynthesis C-methylase UbiE
MSDSDANLQSTSVDADLGEAAQSQVNAYFDSTASYWDGVYGGENLQDLIYQRRQSLVLTYVEAGGSSARPRALEIGCGAGHLTTRLAACAASVDAVDASQAMADATAARVKDAKLDGRVSVRQADAHTLPFSPEHFDLVVAVGVIPWLHSPAAALVEIGRVLRPGGRLVLTADNRARLTSFTDPRRVIAIAPLKKLYRRLRRVDTVGISRLDSPRSIDRMLAQAGMRPVARATVGFGPLSFMGRAIFEGRTGLAIDRRLQALADRGTPGLRWTGWHYVVCAEKL